MTQDQRHVCDYLTFQSNSQSPFHCVAYLKESLKDAGFNELKPFAAKWVLKSQKGYFIEHPSGKALFAFRVGKQNPAKIGFSIGCAHIDSPVFRLKLNPWKEAHNISSMLPEVHGSVIARSWLDKPLVLAGAVYEIARENDKVLYDSKTALPLLKKQLVQSTKPVGIIPDVAIHLDREKNKLGAINLETMFDVICASLKTTKIQQLWEALDVTPSKVDGFELSFAPFEPHRVVGLDSSMISGPRHDDLAMVFALSEGLKEVSDDTELQRCAVVGFFDSEESGSMSAAGAQSSFFRDQLLRIVDEHPAPYESARENALTQSFVVSADMAHAFHPCHAEKYDPYHKVHLNQGLVIKQNANDYYSSSGESIAIMRAICEKAGAKVQAFMSRQDMTCGSTVGPFIASQLSCPSVDVGTPMWAMHSTQETLGTKDLGDAIKIFRCFFEGE